jgi:hypothetical protein
MSTNNSWPYNNTLDDSTDITTISLTGSAGTASMIDTYLSSNVYVTSGVTSGTGLNWGYNDTISITSGGYENLLSVNGDAEIKGKLKVDGRDIGEILNKIEERLAILRPNPELESRWDELRELGERYRALEADLTEKELMWSKLIK